MRNRLVIILSFLAGLSVVGAFFLPGCSSGSSSSSSSTTTTSGVALNANQTSVASVTSPYTGTCEKVTRDTTSCQSARTALGLSGNWLSFSCNVVLGLADSSGNTTTTFSDATYVTITTTDLPDHTSNYFPTSGSYSFTANGTTIAGTYDSMYTSYTTSFPDPSTISAESISMKVPLNPAHVGTVTMAGGAVGISIDGVVLFDNLADATDNIFAEAGSFDTCQGHPANGKFHYHSEPYAISYNDNNLIGVMRDGFFIYGRKDFDSSIPGSTSALETAGNTSDIYKFGGHSGGNPLTGSGSTWHYHLTEWEGCYNESGGSKGTDDGQTIDTLNSPSSGLCTNSGAATVDTWFFTGHGNGGAFMTVPSGLSGQSPSQNTAGVRYYYGTPGTCTGC